MIQYTTTQFTYEHNQILFHIMPNWAINISDSSEVRNGFYSLVEKDESGEVWELFNRWNKAIKQSELLLEVEKKLSGSTSPGVCKFEIGDILCQPDDFLLRKR